MQSEEAKAHFQQYHTIRGCKRFGMIIDPGAASGLGGTDTKVEYDANNVPHCQNYDVVPATSSFSGIDGEPVKGLGTLRQIAQIGRLMIRWHGDLNIGLRRGL